MIISCFLSGIWASHNIVRCFPSKIQETLSPRWTPECLYNLMLERTTHCFCHLICSLEVSKSSPGSRRGGYHIRVSVPRSRNYLGPSRRLPTTSNFSSGQYSVFTLLTMYILFTAQPCTMITFLFSPNFLPGVNSGLFFFFFLIFLVFYTPLTNSP